MYLFDILAAVDELVYHIGSIMGDDFHASVVHLLPSLDANTISQYVQGEGIDEAHESRGVEGENLGRGEEVRAVVLIKSIGCESWRRLRRVGKE